MRRPAVIPLLLALTTILATSAVYPRQGAYLRQLTERDSILIADRLEYGVLMEAVPDSVDIQYPEVKPDFMDNVLAIPQWQVDTVKSRKVKGSETRLNDIRARILIQPFMEGVYQLPALSVVRDGDTLVFEPLQMDVRTMPVDTATFEIHDIKGQIKYPLTATELFPWVMGFIFLVLAVGAIVCLILMRTRKSQEPVREKEPAHITALRKLDKLRGDKFWEPDRQKGFYTGVTDALREYIVSRYGVEAMEMTTAEIFEGLKGTDVPEDLYVEMKDLFERADFVKFAKFTVPREENAGVIPQAVRFITSTYQSQVEEEAKEGEA